MSLTIEPKEITKEEIEELLAQHLLDIEAILNFYLKKVYQR